MTTGTGTGRILASALLVSLAACNQPEGSAPVPVPEETGIVVLSLTNAPPDATCLRITVKGATTAVRSLPLVTGTSASFTLEGLPSGAVQFTAETFGVACASVAPESIASWVSDAVSATLVPGQISNVSLALHRPGRAKVAVDFPLSCSADSGCPSGTVCIGGVCKKSDGGTCATDSDCASGFCAGGVCTPSNNNCGGSGLVCAPNQVCIGGACKTNNGGACAMNGDCLSGLCWGGVCKKPDGAACQMSGECASGLCAGGVCTASGCGAMGVVCAPGSICVAGNCKKTDGGACVMNGECASGLCLGGTCSTGPSPGPALQWKFDESMGSIALDASGHGRDGTYLGATASTVVPAAGSAANPFSRLFARATQQAVKLAATPVALKPANTLTLSAWYRATSVDTSGAELISAGDNYVLRLRATQIEFDKRITGSSGTGTYATCPFGITTHLDGTWHHLAAVSGPTGMKVYLDGVEKCTNAHNEDLLYDRGQDFWVGRHGNGSTAWDFEGNIDDVRVYGRALTAAEIGVLAAAAQ